MGFWSFYFLAKLACYALGLIHLDWLLNALFAVALLALPQRWRLVRSIAAWSAGIAILWHESWLPPPAEAFAALLRIQTFDAGYLLELAERWWSWQVITLWALAAALHFWLSRRLRLGAVVLVALLLVPVLPVPGRAPAASVAQVQGTPAARAAVETAGASAEAEASDRDWPKNGPFPPSTADAPFASDHELEQALAAFRNTQRELIVPLPQVKPDVPSFDLVILSICSLSWDDLAHAGLADAPFLRRFDVLFKRFNSAASYSGPAVARLMRGQCGQVPEAELTSAAPPACNLLRQLAQVGFAASLRMNHDGHFDGFGGRVMAEGGFADKAPANTRLPIAMTSFDGSPILDDHAVLSDWSREAPNVPYRVLFYNTVSLHDGNRLLDQDGGSSLMTWKARSAKLFADVERWMGEVERRGRRTVVLVVPEHGAGIRGDAYQFPGLREWPTPSLTHVPAGLILLGFGEDAQRLRRPVVLDQVTSYPGLMAAVSVVMAHPQAPHEALSQLAQQWPESTWVAENQQVVVMRHRGRTYLRDHSAQWREMTRMGPEGPPGRATAG
jgi:cellulose synthase operon protein YhjU